ncbi:C39 family peptidase [Terribacillus sp. 179-K 1B1 HS]|uniref:C39 family peptidase n=1 Tax=Terribacillus sp. 179-K 1B1 HS TaxID=3142388 RepID=UPI0039A3F0C9
MKNRYVVIAAILAALSLVLAIMTYQNRSNDLRAESDISTRKEEISQKEGVPETSLVEDGPLDVPLLNQMDAPKLYNGCEVTSLAMILQYAGYDVTKNDLADQIAYVPLNYNNGQHGDPNEGFVGDMPNGPGLGVYHGPIMEVAKEIAGDKAVDVTGESVEEAIYKPLENGKPVWIITTSSFAPVDDMETWETPNGQVDVTYSVHSVAVTGYTDDTVFLNNPYGQKNQEVDRENFEKAWEQLGSQAIYIND